MNKYYQKENYMVGVCSDGTEFIFDMEDYEKVSPWNWMNHRNVIEGADGKKRISLGKLIMDVINSNEPVLRKEKNFDYRKNNLYSSNTYIDKGDYYEVKTIKDESFYIDKNDYNKVRKYRWFLNTQKYPEARKNGKPIRLHRYLLDMNEDFTYDRVVDHIDRNPCNNRMNNLRIVSQAENTRNRCMGSNNTSSAFNVFWGSNIGAWRASRVVNGVKYNVGNFNTIEEAESELKRLSECLNQGKEFISKSTRVNKRNSSTGHKYIYNHKPHGYTINVVLNNKRYYLGLYDDIEEAITVRDKYLKEHK